MTESALAIVIATICGVFVATVWKNLSNKETRDTSLNLLITCFKSFLNLQTRAAWISLPIVGLLLFVGFAIVRPHRPSDPCPSSWVLGSWVALTFLLGALASSLQQSIVTFVNTRLTIGGFVRFRAFSTTDQKAVALRISLVPTAICAVIALVIPMTAHLLGAVILNSNSIEFALLRSPFLLLGYALGVSLSSLIQQVHCGLLRSTALTASRENLAASFCADDPRNPAAAALNVGRLVTRSLTTSTELFATTTLAICASLVHGSTFASANRQALAFAGSALAFPATVIAFGLIASSVGVFVVRQVETEAAARSFDRGLLVTVALTVAAVAGASRWLFDALWLLPFTTASLGAVAVFALTLLARKLSMSSSGEVQHLEAQQYRGAMGRMKGLSHGAMSAAALVFFAFTLMALGCVVGHVDALSEALAYSLTCLLAGIIAPSVYVATQIGASTLLPFHSAVERFRNEPSTRKAKAIIDVTASVDASSHAWLANLVSTVIFALTLDSSRKVFNSSTTALWPSLAMHSGWGFTSIAILGCALVLGLLWRATGFSASTVCRELTRHVAEARERGVDGELPSDYAPEHRACFDLISAEAIRSSAAPLLAALGHATLLAVASRLVFSDCSSETAASPLVATIIMLAGLSEFLEAGAAVWHGHWVGEKSLAANRKSAVDGTTDSANNHQNGAAVASDTVGDMFRHLTVPSIHAIMKVLVTATVVLAPLFQ
jgi:Na+/H+-translocating membrane pyrophosphatase